jgi:hypothetical protein
MRERVVLPTLAVAAFLAVSPGSAGTQDHDGCPMHQAQRDRAAVDRRHQEATALPSDGIEHRFLLTADGGSIQLEVRDPMLTEGRDRVREHLRTIARAFGSGDFSLPTRIHDRVPPGAETMKARRDAIRYTFSETPRGGAVAISTSDPAALAAVHEFLEFQISDHVTGHPIH